MNIFDILEKCRDIIEIIQSDRRKKTSVDDPEIGAIRNLECEILVIQSKSTDIQVRKILFSLFDGKSDQIVNQKIMNIPNIPYWGMCVLHILYLDYGLVILRQIIPLVIVEKKP